MDAQPHSEWALRPKNPPASAVLPAPAEPTRKTLSLAAREGRLGEALVGIDLVEAPFTQDLDGGAFLHHVHMAHLSPKLLLLLTELHSLKGALLHLETMADPAAAAIQGKGDPALRFSGTLGRTACCVQRSGNLNSL